MSLSVRERLPLRLHATVRTPSGQSYRWGQDDPSPERALAPPTFSTTMPGGFEQATLTLARKPTLDYPDLAELSTVQIRGVGAEIAWEGRMESSPRTSGQQMSISPGLVGWQNHLQDDPSARAIFLDIDLSQWQPGSINRKIALATGGTAYNVEDPSTAVDTSDHQAVVVTRLTAPWSGPSVSEAWYDARGLELATVYYGLDSPLLYGITSDYHAFAFGSSDDLLTALTATSDLFSGGANPGTLALPPGRREAVAMFLVDVANSGAVDYVFYWKLGVVGRHGLTIRGAWPDIGVLASDVVAYALAQWAPRIAFSADTIQPSSFVIPHLSFIDPTTAANVIQQATRFELEDWAVWEGPTFWMNPRGGRGRKWRARVRPMNLSETGPTIDRLFNGVVVTYTDVAGVSRSVGPTGSGATMEDASLGDPDPLNPLNELGLRRWGTLQMGTSTPDAAIQIGSRFLQEQKLVSTAGQAQLTGYVEDAITGLVWPAWMVRAGDQIAPVDAADPSYRRVVRSSYDDASKSCSVDLDAPPDGMQQLLERLSVELVPLGLS